MTARSTSLLLLLGLTAALGLLNAWSSGETGAGIDFYQFWAVGQAVEERLVENVYDPSARPRMAAVFGHRAEEEGARRQMAAARFRSREIQAASTPFLYWFFNRLETGSFESDFFLYRILALAGGVLSLAALCRIAGHGLAGTLAFLGFFLWAFPPIQDDLRDGNVNLIQLTLITLYLVLARGSAPAWRQVLGGAVLGLAIAFKPNLALIAVCLGILWIVTGRYRRLLVQGAGMAGGGVAAVLVSSLFFGSLGAWTTWLGILRELDRQFDVAVGWGNFAVARLIRDGTGLDLSGPLYVVCLGAVAAALWYGRRRAGASGEPALAKEEREQGDELLMAGLGPVIPLIAAGLAWPHYLVLAIPLCARLTSTRARPRWSRWSLGAALLCIASTPALAALGVESIHVQAALLALGSVLLFILGCREILPPRPVAEEGADR